MRYIVALVVAAAACSPPRSIPIIDDGGTGGSGGSQSEAGASDLDGVETDTMPVGDPDGHATQSIDASDGPGTVSSFDGPPSDVPVATIEAGTADVPIGIDVPPVPGLEAGVPGAEAGLPGAEAGVPGLFNGATCGTDGACNSGHCVDGLCCESACSGQCEACAETGAKGKCVAVTDTPRGTRNSCTGAGSPCGGACNGNTRTACTYPAMEKECAAATCQSSTAYTRSVCDGKGACPKPTMVSCAPLGCDGVICAGGCSPQNPCPSTSYCSAGKCFPKQQLGATCSTPDSCQTGQCVDAVCCDTACTGACQTCVAAGNAGHCSPVKSADDPECTGGKSCDSTGACKARAGSSCSGGPECATGNCVDGKCCTQSVCGSCQACTGGGGTCVSVTNADDDSCVGTCDASGACKSKQGQLCTKTSGGCVGGTSCSPDGVCCDQPCTEACKACDLQGYAGTCIPVAIGGPHAGHGSCGSGTCGGTCVGRADGQCSYPTSTCGAGPTCSGTSYVGQSTCSNGTCSAPAAQPCSGGFICSGNACKGSCMNGTDCLPGYSCTMGTCRAAVSAIWSGPQHNCVLLSDRTAKCWGYNGLGQIGNGTTADVTSLPAVVSGLTSATALATGNQHTCALLSSGTVQCWGDNSKGELGVLTNPPNRSVVPVAVPGLTSVVSVGAGFDTTCVVLADGTGRCWGHGEYGQLGNGNTQDSASPGVVTGLTGASSVAMGAFHACAVIGGGAVKCWGMNQDGQLGNGTTTNSSVPVSAQGLTGVTMVAAGMYHTCALLSDRTMSCWGGNGAGQLFSPASSSNTTVPAAAQNVSNLVFVSGSAIGTCVVDNAGQLTCRGGFNLVNVGSLDRSESGIKFGVSGGAHGCFLRTAGEVWCWGHNGFGELGDGTTTTSQNNLVEVLGL
jgi:alpha-tubulin suppressor-like RCC1 family protein